VSVLGAGAVVGRAVAVGGTAVEPGAAVAAGLVAVGATVGVLAVLPQAPTTTLSAVPRVRRPKSDLTFRMHYSFYDC